MDLNITSNLTNATNMLQISQTSTNVNNMLKQLGYSVEGRVIDVKDNRIILDNGSNEYLDINLKSNSTIKKFNSSTSAFDDVDYGSIYKGDSIKVSPTSILDIKSIPKSNSDQDVNINNIDLDRQTLYSFNLSYTKENVDALNILKDNGMPITKNGISAIANLSDKFDFIIDNSSPKMIDTISNLYSDADSMNIDMIVSEMKRLADSLPLSSDEISSIDIDSIVQSLGTAVTDPAVLKNIVSSIIRNQMSPTKNNVNKVTEVLADIQKIKNIDGKTIGYVVKNKVSVTINNLLKTKLSLSNLGNIVSKSNDFEALSNSQISESELTGLTGDIKKVLSLNELDATTKNIEASKILIRNDLDINKDNVTDVNSIIDDVSTLNNEINPDITCKLIKYGVDIKNTDIKDLISDIDKIKAGISIYDNTNNQTAKFLAPRMSLDSKKSENNLKNILTSMNIEISKDTLTAAKTLISAGIDISDQSLKKALSLLQNISSLNSINVKDLPKILSYIISEPNYMVDKNSILRMPVQQLINNFNTAIDEINSKDLWNKIQTNNEVDFSKFASMLESASKSNYKALGFIFRNNLDTTLVNINKAQEIIIAKANVKLNSVSASNSRTVSSSLTPSVDITTASDNSALAKINYVMPKDFSEPIENSLTQSLKQLLSKMGLPDSTENINIAKALLQNTIPLDKQKIMEITDIKQAIKNIYDKFNFIESLPDEWENIDIRKLSGILDKNLNTNEEYIYNKNYKIILSSILSSVDELSSDVTSFMIKNSIPFTLKNIYGTKMFLDDKFLLGKQLGELKSYSAVCNNSELKAKIRNLLDSFISQSSDFSKLKESTKDYFDKLSNAAKDIYKYVNRNNITQGSAISKTAYDINLNLELQDKFNLNNTLLQIPINMNNQAASLQIYVMNQNKKSNKRKLDANDMDVFLHLNTETMGTVDTFLNFKNKHLTLRVNVENESAKELMEDNIESLITPIKGLGFESTKVLFFNKYADINIKTADKVIQSQLETENDDENKTVNSQETTFSIKA